MEFSHSLACMERIAAGNSKVLLQDFPVFDVEALRLGSNSTRARQWTP